MSFYGFKNVSQKSNTSKILCQIWNIYGTVAVGNKCSEGKKPKGKKCTEITSITKEEEWRSTMALNHALKCKKNVQRILAPIQIQMLFSGVFMLTYSNYDNSRTEL